VIKMLPWISAPWMSLLIMDELKRLEPTLALQSADAKVLQICCSDFKNYMEHLECVSVKSEVVLPASVGVEVNLTSGDYHVIADDKNVKEVVEFVQMWVRGWWKKYKERVQVTIVKSPRLKEDKLAERGTRMTSNFSNEEKQDIIKAVIETLIKNGEICCTEILSNALFTRILGRYSSKTEWNQEKKLNFMMSVIKEARRMCRVHGPLIFIKPDERYYKLREFRDDGKPQTI